MNPAPPVTRTRIDLQPNRARSARASLEPAQVAPGAAETRRSPEREDGRVGREAERGPAERAEQEPGGRERGDGEETADGGGTEDPARGGTERLQSEQEDDEHAVVVTAIPAAIPASPKAARPAHSTGMFTTNAVSASAGSQRVRPRTKRSGKATESATEAIIQGER